MARSAETRRVAPICRRYADLWVRLLSRTFSRKRDHDSVNTTTNQMPRNSARWNLAFILNRLVIESVWSNPRSFNAKFLIENVLGVSRRVLNMTGN